MAEGVGALVGSLANSATGFASTLLTNRANKKLAQYAYTKDLEQWNRANEYNSPKNQMARLKEAGINPNMVFGGGQVAGNTASQTIPKYQAPNLEAPQLNYNTQAHSQVLSRYQNIQQSQVQVDMTREQLRTQQLENQVRSATIQASIDMRLATAKTQQERAIWQGIKNKNEALNYQYNTETYGTRVAGLVLKNDLQAQQIATSQFARQLGFMKFGQDERRISQYDRHLDMEFQRLQNEGALLPYRVSELQFGNILKGQQGSLNQREIELQKYGTSGKDNWFIRNLFHRGGKVEDAVRGAWRKRDNRGGSW